MNDRIEQLEALLQSEPDDVFCLYGLAMEYARAGDAAAAIRFFDRALAADPDYLYAYYHKARCLMDADDPAAARHALESGIARADAGQDAHAADELRALLDELD
ncbi:MAG: tetratricopeptide repeat protein [Planctomycetota bacterium]|jgi:predicted Zn-dependent protease